MWFAIRSNAKVGCAVLFVCVCFRRDIAELAAIGANPRQSVGSPPAAHGGKAPLPSAEFLFTSSALTTAVLARTILVILLKVQR
jgi:hypothetical protein